MNQFTHPPTLTAISHSKKSLKVLVPGGTLAFQAPRPELRRPHFETRASRSPEFVKRSAGFARLRQEAPVPLRRERGHGNQLGRVEPLSRSWKRSFKHSIVGSRG